MKANRSEQQAYFPQLDALRFVAVLGVMVVHNWHPKNLPWLVQDLDWGALGVRLFFVLSGFLITGILIRCRILADESGLPPMYYIKQFYIRRMLRIFPIYYLTIIVALVLNIASARENWPWLVTYTSNVYITLNNTWIDRMGHFWTLAVEEHFYLVWPWLVLFAPRKWLIPTILAAMAVGPLYRAFAYVTFPFNIGAMDFKAGTLTPGALDTLGMGALLALVWHTSTIPKERVQKVLTRAVLPAGILLYLATLLIYHYRIKPSIYFVLSDFAMALIFVWLISSAAIGFKGIVGKVLEFPPLVYLGKITYGIYIYHNLTPLILIPIFEALEIPLRVPGPKTFVLSSILTIAIAMLSWHLIELPINNLKRYFNYDQPRVDKAPVKEQAAGESQSGPYLRENEARP